MFHRSATLKQSLGADRCEILCVQVSSRRICQEGTEEDLCRADAEERAVRSLGRILAAGTPFVFQDHYDNRVTMQDFKLLLGDLFNPSEFQPNSGRAFLAG